MRRQSKRRSSSPYSSPYASRPISLVSEESPSSRESEDFIRSRIGPQVDKPDDYIYPQSVVEANAASPPHSRRPSAQFMQVRRKSMPIVPSTIRVGATGKRASLYVFDGSEPAPLQQRSVSNPLDAASGHQHQASTSTSSHSAPPSPTDASARPRPTPLQLVIPDSDPTLPTLMQASRSAVPLASNRWGMRRVNTMPPPRQPSEEEDKAAAVKATKRRHAIEELIRTEREYFAVLTDINDNFYRPMLGAVHWPSEPLCDPRALKEIFSNFPAIFETTKALLAHLDGRSEADLVAMSPTTPSSATMRLKVKSKIFLPPAPVVEPLAIRTDRPGSIILPLVRYFQLYYSFMQNHPRSIARIAREQESNPVWRNFMSDARRKKKTGQAALGLGTMLLNICQRVPRYRMLLNRIKAYTDESHPDYDDLDAACGEVEQGVHWKPALRIAFKRCTVASQLNAMMTQHSTAQTAVVLQRLIVNLDFQLVLPGRRLLKMGRLRSTGARGDDAVLAFFLFSDMLLCATQEEVGGLSRSLSMVAGVADMLKARPKTPTPPIDPMLETRDGRPILYRLQHRLSIAGVTVTAAKGNSFEVHSSIRSYSVAADSIEAKHAWVDRIREANADYIEGQSSLLHEERRDARHEEGVSSASPLSSPTDRRASSGSSAFSPRSSGSFSQPPSQSARDILSMVAGRPHSGSSETMVRGPAPGARPHDTNQPLPVAVDYIAPIWMPDSKSSGCMRCSEVFNVIRRRHHCRLCGDIVCAPCSPREFIIPASSNGDAERRARACHPCYDSAFTEWAYEIAGLTPVMVTSATATTLADDDRNENPESLSAAISSLQLQASDGGRTS